MTSKEKFNEQSGFSALSPIDPTSVSKNYCKIVIYFHSSTLVSGIVSTALQCGTGRCPTDNKTLDLPVIVTVRHSVDLQVKCMPAWGTL